MNQTADSKKTNDVAGKVEALIETIKKAGEEDPKGTQDKITTVIKQLELERLYLDKSNIMSC